MLITEAHLDLAAQRGALEPSVLEPCQRCRSCGEVLIELTERGRQERLAAERLVDRGIRSGVEVKFVRKLAGLRASEITDTFGVRKKTVSRWERGEVEIPRTAAYALGELFAHQ